MCILLLLCVRSLRGANTAWHQALLPFDLQVSGSAVKEMGILCISAFVSTKHLLELMNLCKLCVSIFYLFFFFSNKKASKTRKDMQGVHEGTGAMLCRPLLHSCVTVYAPVRVQQHVPSALSCTPSSLCFLLFLSNCLTTRRNRKQSAYQSQREVTSN